MKLILASQSERRQKLLKELGYDFSVVHSRADEAGRGVYCLDVPLLSAVLKAREVSCRYPDSLVIGADTVIEFNGAVIGKPVDLADARDVLSKLSGRSHYVVTGVCLLRQCDFMRCAFAVKTEVVFKKLTSTAINEYLDNVHVLDKAGAYAIQEYGEMLVKSINGPLDNVVGLPCEKLAAALRACRFAN